MTELTHEEKLAQFDEFFSIEHNFNVNLQKVEKDSITSFDDFIASMPMPFKMAGEMTTIDQAALRPLQGLSGVASQLVDFLNHQSHKIELLVGYILSQQDDESMRFKGVKFGGGGIIFQSDKPFALGDYLELKVFLLDENCAVFCLGEVVELDQVDGLYHHKVIFHFIRDEDQEALVRHSLHQQSKQLQELAQKRKQQKQD